jgi:hypothetical protein
MIIRVEGNIGKCTGRVNPAGDTKTAETRELSLITAFLFTHLGILKLTPDDNLLTASFYVVYRRQHPDKATVREVLKELKKNKIDVCKLRKWPTDHCQQGV